MARKPRNEDIPYFNAVPDIIKEDEPDSDKWFDVPYFNAVPDIIKEDEPS